MYTLVTILCSYLNYIYITSGRVYIKVEECFYYKEEVENELLLQHDRTYEK